MIGLILSQQQAQGWDRRLPKKRRPMFVFGSSDIWEDWRQKHMFVRIVLLGTAEHFANNREKEL